MEKEPQNPASTTITTQNKSTITKVDERRRRATYNQPYPPIDSEVLPESIKELNQICVNKNQITQKRIQFKFNKKTIDGIEFYLCQFFKDDESENLFKEITFKNCRFKCCFMGSVEFNRVRFENCSFHRVDFSRTIFTQCTFDNCSFDNISCYNGIFISTELDSIHFFRGIKHFEDHYTSEETNEFSEFNYNCLILAKHIYSSNSNIDNHRLSDRSLVQLKKIELKIKIENFKASKFSSLFKLDFYLNLVHIFFTTCNLLLTKGGTSLTRLAISNAIAILTSNWILQFTTITNSNNIELKSDSFVYIANLPNTLSLFFSYGYTAFKANSQFDLIILNFVVLVGILFYALLISVFIRKIYK